MKPGEYKWWGYLVLMALAFAVAAGLIFLIDYLDPVQAASDTPVFPCVAVAKTSTIVVYRCMDEDMNSVFYMNDLGFMMPWE